jgi:hypothetical protein
MAIELGFTPWDEDHETEIRLVERDKAVVISDFSEGEERFIVVGCNKNGGEGYVCMLPPEGPIAEVRERDVFFEDLPDAMGTIKIEKGRPSHEQDMINDSRYLGTLSVRYARDDKITSSFLIPEGLIHPN